MTVEPPTEPAVLEADGPDVPVVAGGRLGQGAWSSGLSVADFASCLALGMEPAAFVQGYCVMQWSSYAGYYGGQGVMGMGGGPPVAARGQYVEQWRCPHGFVGGEHRTFGFNYEQTWVENSWATGWGLAYRRMLEEATAIDAHGVIGIIDDVRPLAGTATREFRMAGTAVRIPGVPVPAEPFTTYLSGQRLAKLFEAGFTPVAVVSALSSVQMVGYCITNYQLGGNPGTTWGGVSGVQSISQVVHAQTAARRITREHIRAQLAGDILHGAELRQSEHEIREGDLAIQCHMKGTRVRPFKATGPLPAARPVVRLV